MKYLAMEAVLDENKKYRYLLHRKWGMNGQKMVFICLNPSTADGKVDDPTLQKCVAIADNNGCHELEIVNLFAFRATDHKKLHTVIDPVGPLNDQYIQQTANSAAIVVLAWGNKGRLKERDQEVLDLVMGNKLMCLKQNNNGCPAHPLYQRADSKLMPFEP